MPFEARASASKNIAVIGAGISGMGAAHMLAADNRVTLFEAEPRLGGHARTIMAGKNGDQPVDTGFIVYNYANYPHLAQLFRALDVPVTKSNMSFGASLDGGRIEYALATVEHPGLANIATTVLNLLGYRAPENYRPSLIEFKS